MKVSFFSTQMRYFLEVAEQGSINQASEKLFVAASAVSRQITRLESAMGCALFERKARGMVPTEAGVRLMAHLRAGSTDAERVLAQMRGLAGQTALRVRLACTEGFAAAFMPAVMTRFRQAHPGCQFELMVASPADVSRLLLQGEADLALKYSVAPEKGVAVLHAANAPVYALMQPDHPLAGQASVTAAQVVQYPLAISTSGMTGRGMFDLVASMQGLQYQPAVISNFSAALLPGVRAGDIVLSGYLSAAHLVREGRLVALPFDEPQLQQRLLQVLALEGRTLTPLVEACAAELIDGIRGQGDGRAQAGTRGVRSARKG
ncbi:MAG: LysR family transcriptional regulator [Pseudomonadota bacterium]